MKFSSRVLTSIAAVSVAALALAGCSAGASEDGEPQPATTTLRIDQRAPAETIDPSGTVALVEVQLSSLLYGRLFEFAKDSATETEPSIAESIEASEDGLTHTVTLDPEAAFSDGSPLTSADVVSSILRVRDGEGFYAIEAANFADVVAVDERTVELTLASPVADLAQTLALPALSIVPAAAADDPEYFTGAPLFSGPFVVEGDWASTSFTLKRNEEFGGARPAVSEVAVTVMPDTATTMLRLQSGETDFSQNIPSEAVSQLSGEVEARQTTTLAQLFVIPNNAESSIFSDVRIRQAIGWAIDRAELAQVDYGTSETANASPYLLSADYPRDPEPYPAQDLDRARELLVGTACEDGCEFALSYFASSADAEGRAAAALQQQLAEIGMTAQPRGIEDTQFINDSLSGAFDLQIIETGGYNTPSSLSGNFDPAAYQCVNSGCANDLAGPALLALQAAAPGEERDAASRAFLELFAEWTPIIPVADSVAPYGVRTTAAEVITVQPNNLYYIAHE